MKKILLCLLVLFISTGCINVQNTDIDILTERVLKKNIKLENQYRTGYKYYLPRGMSIIDKTDYNEILVDDRNIYYLYIDLISNYNNIKTDYEEDYIIYYSRIIKKDNKEGFLSIKESNDKYLVEMVYNYAKIEVMVDESDIKSTVINSITILSSIEYNKEVVDKIVGSDEYSFTEEQLDIFKNKKNNESNMLQYEEEYGTYKDDKEDIPDLDVIE
jgi:hypothetical protein